MVKRRVRKRKRVKFKKPAVIASAAAALLLIIAIFVINLCYFKTTIASGVSICGIDVGGMTKAEAKSAIASKSKSLERGKKAVIEYGDVSKEIDYSELSPEANLDATVNAAYNIGKNGSFLTRLSALMSAKTKNTDVRFVFSFDSNAIDAVLEPVIDAIPGSATPTDYVLSDDGITVIPGTEGNLPDYDALYSDLSAAMFEKGRPVIQVKIAKASYDDLTAEDVHKRFYSVVKDASYIRDEDGNITVSPDSSGIDFNVSDAQKILDKANGKSCTIPIEMTKPSVTEDELLSRLFTDELSSYYSSYVVGNTGRNTNLELACSKLDRTQLMPGDVFSYVGVVGQGTYDEGYVDAAVYADGEVTTGVAGGICQGSSTLYSAVLFADLEIVQRVNHSMPVGYVPRGMDATIAVPYIDFQFRNSTGYPIKISAVCNAGQLDIKLLGFNEHPEKEVEITNKLISTTPFEVKENENASLAEGEEIVKQNGSDGCVIETYKTIKINGVEQGTTLVSTSRYDPIDKIVEIPPKLEDEETEKRDAADNPEQDAGNTDENGEDADAPDVADIVVE